MIKDTNDLVEWLANRHGVITVNNDDPSQRSDKILLRLAAAVSPDHYAVAVNSLITAFDEIKNAPIKTPLRSVKQEFEPRI